MRERLTITLKKELLEGLDSTIDGEKLRNRSHAIEYYLSKSLGITAMKVLILAGGKPVYPHTFDSEYWGQIQKNNLKSHQQLQKIPSKSDGASFESEKK